MGRVGAGQRGAALPPQMTHTACSLVSSAKKRCKPADFSALPLLSAEPKPCALAIDKTFFTAAPAKISRLCRSTSGAPPSASTTSASKRDPRSAFSRACWHCWAWPQRRARRAPGPTQRPARHAGHRAARQNERATAAGGRAQRPPRQTWPKLRLVRACCDPLFWVTRSGVREWARRRPQTRRCG